MRPFQNYTARLRAARAIGALSLRRRTPNAALCVRNDQIGNSCRNIARLGHRNTDHLE